MRKFKINNTSKICFLLMFLPVIVNAQISQNKIDSMVIAEMRRRQITGLSLAIIQDGEVIHKKAYGYAVVLTR